MKRWPALLHCIRMKVLDTARRQPRSVLVVDSNPDVLALISVILEGPKTSEKPTLRVLRARNIPEALAVLNRAYVPVHLVLSNQSLPESDGQGLLERIREIRPQVPVMYMSAITESETIRIRGSKAGIFDAAPQTDERGFLRAVVAALEPARALGNAGVS